MPGSEMITIFLPKKVIAIHKTRNRNDRVTHVLVFHVGRQKQLLIESSDVGFPKTALFITSGTALDACLVILEPETWMPITSNCTA